MNNGFIYLFIFLPFRRKNRKTPEIRNYQIKVINPSQEDKYTFS